MPEHNAVRCVVSGLVQGVCFRASTAERATALGICGRVRNLADGSVELIAAGAPDAIEALVAWLWKGPARARVHSVALEPWDGMVEPGFRVLR